MTGGEVAADDGSAGRPGASAATAGPADRLAASEPRLVAAIREEIEAAPDRRITFARFMERALTEPALGYYATSALRPTREGDFLTAPELHPFFGRCIGRLLVRAWERMGSPAAFTVQEWGAGRGTLGRTIADGLAADGSALAAALAWQPIDLPGRHAPAPDAPFTGVVLANEYLDALPVHRLERRGGRLLERWVTWRDGWFAEEPGEPSGPEPAAILAADGIELAEGQLAEVRPGVGPWLAAATASLERGLVLVIDYGHDAAELYGPRRMAGTLVTYRGHAAGDDPFAAVGREDLTTHVDLTQLAREAAALGLVPLGDARQGEVLAGLGIADLLSSMGRAPGADRDAYLLARASVLRLLDPRHLGGFRVVAFGRGIGDAPVVTGIGR